MHQPPRWTIRKPFWRTQTEHWYVKVNGKAVRLSDEPDPDGKNRKAPPAAVQNAWHKLSREGVPSEIRLADVFEKFSATCTDPQHAKSTKWMLSTFLSHVGKETKASALRPYHLSAFFKSRAWAPASVRTCGNRIHAAINWAVREGLLDKNPVSSVPGYKRAGHYTKRKGTIDTELMDRLTARARPAFRAFLIALRETGCRPSEIRRAKIEKCDLEAGVLLVPNKTARATGEAERVIYLSETMKGLIRTRKGSRATGYIFLTERGKPWSYDNAEERWRVLAGKVEVPEGVTLYTLRRSFISTAINQTNVNPALVAQLVGHVGLDMMLKHYLMTDQDALKRAVQEITRKSDPN